MTLIEIAQEAKTKQLFKHDEDDAELYFDNDGELTVRDEEYIDYGYTLTQEEILSDKWHFIEE